MRRLTILILVVLAPAYVCGCGGGGSSSGGGASAGSGVFTVVRVQDFSVSPPFAGIRPGDTVQWLGATAAPRVVVSGTVAPVPPAQQRVAGRIAIQPNNVFVPQSLDINLGDAVQWQNLWGRPFQLEIVDGAGGIVTSINLDQGQVAQFSGFPTAGVYTFRQQGNPLFAGTLRVFGVPVPDNLFQSPTLTTGDTFKRQFITAGTFPYFIIDPTAPNVALAAGVVQVQ